MSTNAPGPVVAPTRREVVLAFSGLMLGMLLAALDQSIVATALPTIVGELGGLDHLSWVVTAYLLASTAATPMWGKLGDLYGRKRIFQTAIVIFLIASMLCGVAQTMEQLIAFRGLQGLGGGGLIVTAQGVVADLVGPRERGRYQGIFGSVFGVASVAGPLLGGFFVDHIDWRWVFYVNLPLGLLALVVIAVTLPSTPGRARHSKDGAVGTRRPTIDVLGVSLIASAATSVILVTTLGGSTWAWSSPELIAMATLAVVLTVAFVAVERRAAEPVLPLSLFRDRTFALGAGIGFIVGFTLLGATTFLPLYLQVVRGANATDSGLLMAPMMGGVLLTSISSGQIITRWGRYKIFPVLGTATMALGMVLLSTLGPTTPFWVAAVFMAVLGAGLGMVMQVLVMAVQNTVPYENLGAATSGLSFFRSIGASFGVALFGVIFTTRLAADLTGADGLPMNEADAYSDALGLVFTTAIPFALLAFVLTLFVREVPLRKIAAAIDPGEAFAMPEARSSLEEVERALTLISSREGRREMYTRLAERAGVALSPEATWLVFRIEEERPATLAAIAARAEVGPDVIAPRLAQLVAAGLVDVSTTDIMFTEAGHGVAERLVAARREGLARMLGDIAPERHAELAELLTRLGRSLTAEVAPEQSGS